MLTFCCSPGFLLAVEIRQILKYFSVYRRDRLQNRIGVIVALLADVICAPSCLSASRASLRRGLTLPIPLASTQARSRL